MPTPVCGTGTAISGRKGTSGFEPHSLFVCVYFVLGQGAPELIRLPPAEILYSFIHNKDVRTHLKTW